MIVLLLIVLVVAAVAGLALLGGSARSVFGLRGSPAVAVGAAGLLVVMAGAVAISVGIGGPESDPPPPGSSAPTSTTLRPTQPSPAGPGAPEPVVAPARQLDPAGLPILDIPASDPGRFGSDATADGLQPESVVRVHATGFDEFETGTVAQCFAALGRPVTCATSFPVQFGINGAAAFQYLLRSSFAPGGCRSGTATCTLRVTGTNSQRQGVIRTVLIDEVSRTTVAVEPNSGVREGEAVVVAVTGFPANSRVTAALCAPPGTYDVRRCVAAGVTSGFQVDAAGSGRSTLVVRSGPLGTDRVMCGPRDPCAVAVVTEEGFEAAPAVPLEFARGPGASYDAGRLAVGLAITLMLVAVAFILARATDWSKPTEAATPEVDAADLQADSSLDELFGTEEELDERYPVEF